MSDLPAGIVVLDYGLASSMEGLRTVPLLAFSIGIIGAALGRRHRVGLTLSLRARS